MKCPPPDTLMDYIQGKIKGQRREEIFKHTGKCTHCVRVISNLYKLRLIERKKKNKKRANE